ncbi:MAG TPA: hypothetical protein VK335_15080 [Bryobacteraceae bacterium]|nr:hypothetical protein [Bryobacteraceae bacterium]
MELLDSYLKAVKFYLPKRQRNDIARELSENILSAIEEREMSLGRALTEAEQAEILDQHGDPWVVARAYGEKRYRLALGWELIGPELFPAYLIFLAFNLAVTLITTLIIGLVLGAPMTVRLFAIPVLAQIGILTLVFTGVNFFRNRYPKPWLFGPPALAPWHPVARWASASGLVMWSVFTLWLLAVPHVRYLIFGPAEAGLKLAEGWQTFYVPILLLLAIGIAQRSINLIHPEWSWLVPFTRVVANFAGLGLQYPIIKSLPWVAVADGVKDTARYSSLAQEFNSAIQWGVFGWFWAFLLINGAIYAWLCVPHIRRLVRQQRQSARQTLRSQ